MGAEVRLDPAGFDIGFRTRGSQAIEDVEARGGTPYAIPAGASDHRLGGLGFANWAYEVAQQEARARRLLRHDRGLHGHRLDARRHDRRLRRARGGRPPRGCIGIDASATLDKTRDQVARIARNTAELIGLGRDLRDDEITVLEGWAGDLYGIPVAVDARRDPAHRPARGHDHRPRLRGQVDGRPDRPGARRRDRRRTRRCSTPTSAASRPSTPTPACSRPPSGSPGWGSP